MSITKFIPYGERQLNRELIVSIASAVFGTTDDADFLENFIPFAGRVPEPKVNAFTRYLIGGPRCLWAVYHGEQVVGFITISDQPHTNAIGFGIKSSFSARGIMAQAWAEIKNHPCIQYPLYAYTTENNLPSRRFLERLGFEFIERMFYLGEPSLKYRKNEP